VAGTSKALLHPKADGVKLLWGRASALPPGFCPARAYMPVLIVTLALVSALSASAQSPYRPALPAEHPAIHYATEPTSDPAACLTGALDLPALLRALHISPSSQMLVFSKDSFQAPRISPRNPRAIYFSDDVAVGFVRGSRDLEIAATDPHLGPIFYTYSAETSKLTRQTVCLKCHQGAATLGVPGLFVGSVFPDAGGNPSRDGAIITDHRTPFADRWGGWYVTARHGEQPDRANGVVADPADPHAIANEGLRNLTSLVKLVNLAGYLEPTSDIVALMTFEHQTQMTNLMTRLAWESRIADAEHKPQPDIREIADYMLFKDEAPMPEPIEGVSTFTQDFQRRGPRDGQGRSLRDFDLRTRLFRYPLSYMIYSAQFDALPDVLRARIYRRLFDVLNARSPETVEIVRDTKPGLPVYWRIHE
jgi:hypothetical protein